MPFRNFFHQLADEQEPDSVIARVAQVGLGTVGTVYGAAAWANRFLHETGARERNTLPAVVFSVGNITLGGTGKTPFTIWLAKWLQSENKLPAVLTRGYGRADEDRLVIVHDGRALRAASGEAGDEPVLIGRALGNVPVIACSNRYRAGKMALKRFALDAFVLDDGLQHVALERQAEIILLDSSRPLDQLRLFPRGTLREPLRVLNRAHLIVLTRCDHPRRATRMEQALRRRLPHVTIVKTRLRPSRVTQITSEKEYGAEWLKGRRVVLACGVGNPESVRRTVESTGAKIIAMEQLDDHARLTPKNVAEWERIRRQSHSDAIVVTEKDAVKLREIGGLPPRMMVLRADLEFVTPEDEERAVKALRARLRARVTRGLIGK